MMKPTYIIFAVASAFVGMSKAAPSEDCFTAVTNDWYSGAYSNVYELAQQRLAVNTNDLAASHIMVEYDVAFSDMSAISNSIVRLLRVSDAETNPAFTNYYAATRAGWICYLEEYLPTLTDEQRTLEQSKSYIPGKRMTCQRMLKLLWDNGLWQQTGPR